MKQKQQRPDNIRKPHAQKDLQQGRQTHDGAPAYVNAMKEIAAERISRL
jgi:hypothetical protein